MLHVHVVTCVRYLVSQDVLRYQPRIFTLYRVEAERARQEQLAKERLAARKAARAARQGAGQEEDTLEVVAPSDDKDLAGLQDAILQETELKHKAEQEALLKVGVISVVSESGILKHRSVSIVRELIFTSVKFSLSKTVILRVYNTEPSSAPSGHHTCVTDRIVKC